MLQKLLILSFLAMALMGTEGNATRSKLRQLLVFPTFEEVQEMEAERGGTTWWMVGGVLGRREP